MPRRASFQDLCQRSDHAALARVLVALAFTVGLTVLVGATYPITRGRFPA